MNGNPIGPSKKKDKEVWVAAYMKFMSTLGMNILVMKATGIDLEKLLGVLVPKFIHMIGRQSVTDCPVARLTLIATEKVISKKNIARFQIAASMIYTEIRWLHFLLLKVEIVKSLVIFKKIAQRIQRVPLKI